VEVKEMTCRHCQERRDAVIDALTEWKIKKAMGEAVIGLAEVLNLKSKPEPIIKPTESVTERD
jgi:hypothetical protein